MLWERVQSKLKTVQAKVMIPEITVYGTVSRLIGATVEAEGCRASVGTCCEIITEQGTRQLAEVVGFHHGTLYLMPYGEIGGIASGDKIRPTGKSYQVPVGTALLGRVVNGLGEPIDNLGPLKCTETRSLHHGMINPMDRMPIKTPLDVGVLTLNLFTTLGKGQRLGLFAGSGVGKSMLLAMLTRFTEADVIVIGLIGERGREVKEFITQNLGPEGMKRTVVVAAPADSTPLSRINGAYISTLIAEYFRDEGKHVLLLMDSLTRFAHAQRELGLAVGEPPATRGYPPSVFAKIPQLIERAGNSASQGSLTAIYTVLAEGDDQQDPVVDSARAILDGHIVLSRRLAEKGHYPAIDVEASVSRSMMHIVSREQSQMASLYRKYHAKLRENEDLLAIGAYTKGIDTELDWAVTHRLELENFTMQDYHKKIGLAQGLDMLKTLVGKK